MAKLLLALTIALTAAKPAPKYAIEADATTVYNDYKGSKTKADAKYLDRLVFLHGIVQMRSLNLWNVYLRIPDPEGMVAVIDGSAIAKAPLYKPGDRFDMICEGAGLVFGLPIFLRCRLP